MLLSRSTNERKASRGVGRGLAASDGEPRQQQRRRLTKTERPSLAAVTDAAMAEAAAAVVADAAPADDADGEDEGGEGTTRRPFVHRSLRPSNHRRLADEEEEGDFSSDRPYTWNFDM